MAITSHALGVVSIVTFAQVDAGAIAKQLIPDYIAGSTGLAMLAEGNSAQAVSDTIFDIDSTDGTVLSEVRALVRQVGGGGEVEILRDIRQIGVVDAEGNVAAQTRRAASSPLRQ